MLGGVQHYSYALHPAYSSGITQKTKVFLRYVIVNRFSLIKTITHQ